MPLVETGKHDYKADQRIEMGVATQYVGSGSKDTMTLEGWTGLNDEDLANMTKEEVESEIEETFKQFVWESIDSWWTIKD